MDFEMKLNSSYICVRDMDRAVRFYEEFLGQPVDVRNEVFSIFVFKGFRFCLFNNSRVGEKVVWGDNCLLSFEVNDINILIEKLNKLKAEIVFPPTRIGDNMVLEFRDSEGNDVEVYSRCKYDAK